MSASLVQPLWSGSYLERLAAEVTRGLAQRSYKVACGVGPAAAALAAAPPAITWVDGENNRESYTESDYQPDEGQAVWDANQQIPVVVRGADVRRADELREALLAVFYDAFSTHAVKPVSGVRRGGRESEQGFTIELVVQVRWQLLREKWMRDVELTGVDATGILETPAGETETIVERSTP